MIPVSALLNQPDRKLYYQNPPAGEAEIQKLVCASPVELPAEYLGLLRFSNGLGAELALSPLLFYLYEISFILELLRERTFDEIHDQFFIFGSNGGLETIAFDLRKGPPYLVVMIDLIGGEDTAVEIAPDIASFVEAIGLERSDKAES